MLLEEVSSDKDFVMTSRNYLGIWRIFSLISGALSLINLIEDFSLLRIMGQLKLWVDAYNNVVEWVFGFFFGWIQFNWVLLENQEKHVLVLALVLISAYYRAQAKFDMYNGEGRYSALTGGLIRAVLWFMICLTPALILPGQYGFWGSIIGVIFLSTRFFTPSQWSSVASGSSVFRELIGVVGCCVLILLVNQLVL